MVSGRARGRRARKVTCHVSLRLHWEKIRLGSPAERPQPDEVSAPGVVQDVVYVGAFTRYVVQLDAGGELVVLQQNLTMSSMDVLQARGRRVRLFWNRQLSRVIATAGSDQKKEEIG